MRALSLLLLTRAALADSSVEQSCKPVPPALAAEAARLLQSAAAHASYSEVCSDGDGQRTAVRVLSSCLSPQGSDSLRVAVRYEVNTFYEVGGECSPYPG